MHLRDKERERAEWSNDCASASGSSGTVLDPEGVKETGDTITFEMCAWWHTVRHTTDVGPAQVLRDEHSCELEARASSEPVAPRDFSLSRCPYIIVHLRLTKRTNALQRAVMRQRAFHLTNRQQVSSK